jgi:hypothetical protein
MTFLFSFAHGAPFHRIFAQPLLLGRAGCVNFLADQDLDAGIRAKGELTIVSALAMN